MANSLNLRGGCGEGPVVECSYDYSTSTPRYKYVIRRATSASYVVGSGSPTTITLTDNAAVGFLSWNGAQSVTITAKGCGCDASCVIPPCCIGKDYLRISFSGFRDLSFHFERTLNPPNFGDRNIFGSWDTTITGLAGLNGTWLIPVGTGGTPQPYQCWTDPIDTGVDVTFTCRWFSYGAAYIPTRVITGETWNQDLVGTVSGRLWLHYDAIYIVGGPGTMVGSASKTVGLSDAYDLTFDSVWSPKMFLGTFENAHPLIYPGNGIVLFFSAHPTEGLGEVGETRFLVFSPVLCGRRVSGNVLLSQSNSSYWVDGEGFEPGYHHSNTGPTSYPGAYAAGRCEGQYISVP
jgi:hypothetical protein